MRHLPTRLAKPKRTLHLPASLVGDMTQEGWRRWPLETGGIILGRTTADGAQVTSVIGPGPEAKHDRYGFTPDSEWQAEQVAAEWAAHPHTEYLGDWHTHPGGTTRFSTLDRETAESIAAYPDAQQPEHYMLVFALRSNINVEAGAAQLHKGRLQPVALQLSPTRYPHA